MRPWRIAEVWIGCWVALAGGALSEARIQVAGRSHLEIQRLVFEGRYAEAEQAVTQLLPLIEAQSGSDSLETAELVDLMVESLLRGGVCGVDPRCLELADQALATRERHLGEDPQVADSLVRKADVLVTSDEFLAAESLLLRARQIYESNPKSAEKLLAEVYGRLADVYLGLIRPEDQEAASRMAVEMAEGADDPDPLALAEALTHRAYYMFAGHQPGPYAARTEPLARRALELRRGALGEGHPLVLESEFFLGEVYFDLERFDESLALMSGVAEARIEHLDPEHPLVAETLSGLSMYQRLLGYPLEAEEGLERAISIFERYPPTSTLARAYSSLGLLRHRQGELVLARESYEAALEIDQKLFGPYTDSEADLLRNLGWLEIDLGELEEARRHLERGLEIVTEIHPEDCIHMPVYLLHLANLERSSGNLAAAERIARRAWAIEESFLGPDQLSLEVVALTLGVILREGGKLEEAEPLLTRVLDVQEAGYNLRNRDLADHLIALGDLLVDLGEDEEAVRSYREALSILEELFGPEHRHVSETLLKISKSLALLGHRKEAFEVAIQAENKTREHTRLMLTGLSESGGLRYAATRPPSLDWMFSLLLVHPEAGSARGAIDAVIRSRALVLDEMADRLPMLSRAGEAGSAEQVERLILARKRLARLSVQGPGGAGPELVDRFRLALAEAEREKNEAERALAEAGRDSRLARRESRAGLRDVEGSLPPRSGLLGFKRFRLSEIPGEIRQLGEVTPNLTSHDSYFAFVVRPGGVDPELVNLGSADEIEALVEAVRSQVARESRVSLRSAEAREREYRRIADRLRVRIWDPIEPYLDGLDTLFVVPDGELNLVNLAALPRGRDGHLAEGDLRIHYLSAERDLTREAGRVSTSGLLAMGNPDFDDGTRFAALMLPDGNQIASRMSTDQSEHATYRGSRSACESFEAMQFEPLPASELEIEDVARTWTSRFPEPPAVELTHGRAAEESFKRLAARHGVVHLATHGFYLGEECPAYDFQKADGELPIRFTDLENPLLRSGLALAGANHRQAAGPEDEDGILTAEEITALDLRNVQWAVLSGCETGVGEARAGEGVFGLRRAFQIAGARTLIMSLWPVDDDATRDWMSALYQHRFAEDLTTIDAVHQANLDLLTSRRAAGLSTHPFYWAGFVAAGDWR